MPSRKNQDTARRSSRKPNNHKPRKHELQPAPTPATSEPAVGNPPASTAAINDGDVQPAADALPPPIGDTSIRHRVQSYVTEARPEIVGGLIVTVITTVIGTWFAWLLDVETRAIAVILLIGVIISVLYVTARRIPARSGAGQLFQHHPRLRMVLLITCYAACGFLAAGVGAYLRDLIHYPGQEPPSILRRTGYWIGGGVVLGVLGMLCATVVFRRPPPMRAGRAAAPRGSMLRSAALATLFVLPLIAIGAGAFYLWTPSDRIVVLVADFDAGKPFGLTDIVLNRLNTALAEYPDVEVRTLNRSFSESDGSALARAEGYRRKASVVIWGWYNADTKLVPASYRVELLCHLRCDPVLGPEARGTLQKRPRSDLDTTLAFQEDTASALTALTFYVLGMARYSANDWQGAVDRFAQALTHTPAGMSAEQLSKIHFFQGNAYGNMNDEDHAIAAYAEAIELDPNFAQAYANTGTSYLVKGNYAQALSYFERAIARNPDLSVAYNNRAAVHFETGAYDLAIADMSQVIALEPTEARAYNGRGVIYLRKKDYALAIQDFARAIENDPSYAQAYENRGGTYKDQGDYDRAIADLNRALSLDDSSADGFATRGIAYMKKGQYDRAIADYTQAIAIDAALANAYAGRGQTYLFKRQLDRALADLNKAIELDQGSGAMYDARGQAYGMQGDFTRAIADFTRAIELEPSEANSYSNRGFAYIAVGDKQKAAADFRKVLDLTSDPQLRKLAEQGLASTGQ